jgi:hypothetical protein
MRVCLLQIDKTRSIKKTNIDCRCDERLKTKTKGSTRLTYTGLSGGLEHLKIETRLIEEMFTSGMGEYVCLNFEFVEVFVRTSPNCLT